jgi:DNA-binding winged helix-turn-helix (wHTH) protein/tetratricopeptide (TPR) repeat protein
MPDPTAGGVFRFDDFTLDIRRHLLLRGGVAVQLTPKQLEMLGYLVRNSGRVVDKDELLKALWPESFVEESNLSQNVFWLRKALSSGGLDDTKQRYIVTIPGKGYRFIAQVTVVDEPAVGESVKWPVVERRASVSAASVSKSRSKWIWIFVAACVLAGVLAGLSLRGRRPEPAQAAGTPRPIVVSEIVNTTDDPAISGPLTAVLRIGLGQSPALVAITRRQTLDTLAAMRLPPDTHVTPDIAAQLCRRLHAAAVVTGSIAAVGPTYVITLEANDCHSGHSFSSGRAVAQKKADIVSSLDGLLPDLRTRLGESVPSVRQFTMPVEQTTTASLDAFEAFAAGDEHYLHGNISASLPLYEKAVSIDPKFAMAYARLGGAYVSLGEEDKASFNFTKAYQLRSSLTPRERLYIEATYVRRVSGDLEESVHISEQDRSTYLLDTAPWQGEGDTLTQLGRFDEAVHISEEGLRRFPNDAVLHIVLARAYLRAGNFDGVKRVADDAATRQMEGWDIHELMWNRAILVNDPASAAAERAWVVGKPDEYQAFDDDAFLNLQQGRVQAAEASQRQFIVVAKKQGMLGYADVDVGNFSFALEEMGMHRDADAIVHKWPASAPTAEIARGLAEVGDIQAAEALGARLLRDHPQDTLITQWSLPVMRAAIDLRGSTNADAEKAIEALKPAEALGVRDFAAPYMRGKAYLRLNQTDKAEAEFRRIIDTPGGDAFSPLYPLAILELARAQAKAHDVAGSKASYERLLIAWRGADANLPVLVQAKNELAALTKTAAASK